MEAIRDVQRTSNTLSWMAAGVLHTMEAHSLCDVRGCGVAAQAFGILGCVSEKYCDAHAGLLRNRNITAYSIEAYSLLSSHEYAPKQPAHCLPLQEEIAYSQFFQSAKRHTEAGVALREAKQCREAEEEFKLARCMLSDIAPRSPDAGRNACELGRLYHQTQRLAEAEEQFQLARSIFESRAPTADAAHAYFQSALVFRETRRLKEAEDMHRLAKQMYDVLAPHSLPAAENCCSFGQVCRELKKFSEAEALHQTAGRIYESELPRSLQAAANLYHMGLALEAAGKVSEAKNCLRAACDISAEHGDRIGKRRAEAATARLVLALNK